mmetsp:Transcript_56757/g.159363  ORF Transcript_56757/g.159363 Transcript_56757/m.159363 type:complete len:387 (-) Transcript_56757:60-1220(-)
MKFDIRRIAGLPTFLIAALLRLSVVAAFHQLAFLPPSSRQQAFSLKAELAPNTDGKWLNHGLLLSSFSDGLKPNPEAVDFLMRGLVASLWRERQVAAEAKVTESAVQSPCCGPDLDAITSMEAADASLEDLEEGAVPWKSVLESLSESCDEPLELRFLYIPTAMYAIRSDSQNTPGKQRQRARADGKSRRNEIVNLLSSQLGDNVSIRAVTLDLDDGSIKQPEGSDDPSKFPKDGKDAFQSWKPNFIYVQGGNTFWLYHCIEKGDWGPDIVRACVGEDAAVYCGTSAGAIVMGASMDTACWKGWDDPSVVPSRENYADWKAVKGFGLVGDASFFPHMDDKWQSLVEEKSGQHSDAGSTYCLRDEEACCVQGKHRQSKVLSSCPTLA